MVELTASIIPSFLCLLRAHERASERAVRLVEEVGAANVGALPQHHYWRPAKVACWVVEDEGRVVMQLEPPRGKVELRTAIAAVDADGGCGGRLGCTPVEDELRRRAILHAHLHLDVLGRRCAATLLLKRRVNGFWSCAGEVLKQLKRLYACRAERATAALFIMPPAANRLALLLCGVAVAATERRAKLHR